MESRLSLNPLYEAWVNSQETILRKLIDRNCTAIQYRYFLVFLLLANRRYGQAKGECERILNIYPNNLMARALMKSFREGGRAYTRRRGHRRARSTVRIGVCARCSSRGE